MKFKCSDPTDFSTGDHGEISGYFATFHHDHGDSYGDVIRKGAFKKTIEERKKTGHPFPLCFNHDFSMIIGMVTDIGEDNFGAWFKAKFFSSEKAQEIRNIVKSGVLWQFSFAFDILDQGKIKAGDGSMVNELRELELYEISIVTVPANDRATITDIKTDRERLLAYISRMEREANEDLSKRKEQLLSSIRNMESCQEKRYDMLYSRINNQKANVSLIPETDLVDALDYLERQEAIVKANITLYDVKGDMKWKSICEQSLEVIREQIKKIGGILAKR